MTDPEAELAPLWQQLSAWYAVHHRDLPWRAEVGPWAVLVCEVMSQQTPVARVEPAWRAWLERWPTPADLAAAAPAQVLRAWDRLGYPRRALRLREAAAAIVRDHDGQVPSDRAALLALPGVGSYTAAAVRAFGFGERDVVLDTNVRRVLARLVGGCALPDPHLGRAEQQRASALLPPQRRACVEWNCAVMELGALVCTARAPQCDRCPVADACAWRAADYPDDEHADHRRSQPWAGTMRQARGRLMAALRASDDPLSEEQLPRWGDDDQRSAALTSLVADGLAERTDAGIRLPH